MNFGVTSDRTVRIVISTTTTAIAVIRIHCHPLSRILKTAQIAMIGALKIICSPMEMTMTICTMSLVDLVTRLEVEKLLISSMEKPATLS